MPDDASSPGSLLILGAGGHGAVMADTARRAGFNLAGFVDLQHLGREVEPGGARVVLLQDELLEQLEQGTFSRAEHLAVAIGDNPTRLSLARSLQRYVNLPPIVHPAAVVSGAATVGLGTQICARAVINTRAQVGAAVIVNTGAIVEHDCIVGDGVHLSPGSILSGGVEVGPRTWIGAGAVTIPGVRIGADAVVGAGAVIIRDVPEGVTVVGNPGRVLRR